MRLTNEMRKQMIVRCVDATFKKPNEQYQVARTAFADLLYDNAFGDMEAKANKLPAGWLHRGRSIEVTGEGFARWGRSIDNVDCDRYFKMSKDRPFPATIGAAFHVKDEHPLYGEAQAILRHDAKLKADALELEQGLTNLRASVATLEKLKAVWPEGEKFFPTPVVKQQAIVPYALTMKINHMMQGVLA